MRRWELRLFLLLFLRCLLLQLFRLQRAIRGSLPTILQVKRTMLSIPALLQWHKSRAHDAFPPSPFCRSFNSQSTSL